MKCLAWVLLMLALAIPAFGQSIHVGLKAGVPMTEYYQTGFLLFPTPSAPGGIQYSAATRRYTVGPTLEWRFGYGLGIEADVLYKRTGYVHDEHFHSPTVIGGVAYAETRTVNFDIKKGSSWDVPMMLKYRFNQPRRFFVTGGYLFRHIGPVRARGTITDTLVPANGETISTTTPIDTGDPSELQGHRNFSGLTVGAGWEFAVGPLRLLPEFRYARWLNNIGGAGGALRLNPNQAEFLVGFLF